MTIIFILAAVVFAAVILQNKPQSGTDKDMEGVFPLWKIEKGAVLSKSGDITIALKLELPEIFSLSNSEYEALHFAWLKAIKMLPVGTIFHKQDWYTEEKFNAGLETDSENFLKRSSDHFFNERPYLAHDCFAYITLKAKDRKPATSRVLQPAPESHCSG